MRFQSALSDEWKTDVKTDTMGKSDVEAEGGSPVANIHLRSESKSTHTHTHTRLTAYIFLV